MRCANSPSITWFSYDYDCGPIRRRRCLYVAGVNSGYFLDTNRYQHDARNSLWLAGAGPNGCAGFVGSGSVRDLRELAERRALNVLPATSNE